MLVQTLLSLSYCQKKEIPILSSYCLKQINLKMPKLPEIKILVNFNDRIPQC